MLRVDLDYTSPDAILKKGIELGVALGARQREGHMQVRYSRTIRPSEFNVETFEIIITDQDVPRGETQGGDPEPVLRWLTRMHRMAFGEILKWQVRRDENMTGKMAVEAMAEFDQAYAKRMAVPEGMLTGDDA